MHEQPAFKFRISNSFFVQSWMTININFLRKDGKYEWYNHFITNFTQNCKCTSHMQFFFCSESLGHVNVVVRHRLFFNFKIDLFNFGRICLQIYHGKRKVGGIFDTFWSFLANLCISNWEYALVIFLLIDNFFFKINNSISSISYFSFRLWSAWYLMRNSYDIICKRSRLH